MSGTVEQSGIGAPFAAGSVSLRLYPHRLPPTALLDELQHQAELAVRGGFDGVTLSERHGGAWGQIPNPLQVSGWLLAAMPTGWAAACPLLLPLRRPAIVAEEVAWLDARFPGRVGVGFGSGGNEPDFRLVGVPFGERAARFDRELREVVAILDGRGGDDSHAGDPAVARARRVGVPMLSAAMSRRAARRAAGLRLGIIGSSLLAAADVRALADDYRAAGGAGPHVVIVRVWLGDPPRELVERQLAEYRHASARLLPSPSTNGLIGGTDPVEIAERVTAVLETACGDALNVRVHVAGLDPAQAREQIAAVASDVVPLVRARWHGSRSSGRSEA